MPWSRVRDRVTTHVFPAVVADVEHLGIEPQPVQVPVDFLTYVRLPPRRY